MADKKDNISAFKTVSRVIKHLFSEAWKFRKGYFIAQVFYTLFNILIPFAAIIMTPYLVDELMGNRDVKLLAIYAAILVGGETLLSLGASLLQMKLEKYSVAFESYFDEIVSKRVMELDFQLIEDKKALDQIEKARTGMSWYSGGVHGIATQFFGIFTNAIKLIGVALLIIINAPILLIVTIALMIITWLLNKKVSALEIKNFNQLSKQNRIFGYVFWDLTDFKNGKDIRLYGAENMMIEKVDNVINAQVDAWFENIHDSLPYNMGITICDVVKDTAVYFTLGYLAITRRITIGVFSQLITAAMTFHQSAYNVLMCIQEIIKRSNYAYEYIKFMEYPAAIEKGEAKVENRSHTLEFRNVYFTYPNTDVQVLKDVSITIKAGERLSVVGLNGAGKTTFVKLLCRLYDVDKGEILLDGKNIKEYDYDEYMKLFSVVFQDFKLLAFSAAENVSLGNSNKDKVEECLRMAGLGEKIKSLPAGSDTSIFKQFDENGIEPSGGEQQKLAIARALYKNSPVVILDEPTAALDPMAEYEIYNSFDMLIGGKTAIYISHRLSSCKFCDRLAVFSDGTIKELGTHDELVNLKDGIYAEMFAAQAQYYK